MTSQWAAVGADTDLLRRARQLQQSWERLLAGGILGPGLAPTATAGLRATIVESWQRSLATGLDPTDSLAPIEVDQSEMLGRWFDHPLGSLVHVLAEQLRMVAEESESMVVVTDASGLVLHRVGDEWLKERAAADMNLVEGARYSEDADGTNGIGTALAADHAFQVFGFEHFNERHHDWVCSGAPVHDPVSGQTVGLIDLSCLWKNAHPRALELVTTAARTIEHSMMDARRERSARLRRRYSDLMTRSTDLLVDSDGYVLEGAELARQSRFGIPKGGGDVVLDDGSVAVAAPLGQGEAYLLRQGTHRRNKSAPAGKGLERAEERARELATEQAALRQVATLVARESSSKQLFAVVAEQVAQIFGVPHVRLVRYEPDGSVVVGGYSEGDHKPFPVGSRWPQNSQGVVETVGRTGRPARVNDYENVGGKLGAMARDAGMRSAVGCPIVVEGRLWGAMVVLTPRREPLPEGTESGLADFTELVAAAIANAEVHAEMEHLADEQAALRRVATLVAKEASPAEVFAKVAQEAGALLGDVECGLVRDVGDGTGSVVAAWGATISSNFPVGTLMPVDGDGVVASVLREGRPWRIEEYSPLSSSVREGALGYGIRSAVGCPVVVRGTNWGVLIVATTGVEWLGPETERRLEQFADLVATAIANADARGEVGRLADEQTALRHVATLVAQDAAPAEIFATVSAEVARVFGLDPATFDLAVVGRFEPGPEHVVVGVSKDVEVVPLGSRWPADDLFAPTHVLRTGRSARVRADDLVSAGGEAAGFLRHHGYLSQVASPIVVDGRLWGAVSVNSRDELPPDTEERLERFTELVATALANADSRTEVERLATQQAALRRVATLVAEGAKPADVFTAVASEVAQLFEIASVTISRYEDDAVVVVADPQDTGFPVNSRWPFDGDSLSVRVRATGRMARIDDYSDIEGSSAVRMRERDSRSAVGAPIIVEGSLWGILCVGAAASELLPADIEARIAGFLELVGTAIANAESSAELDASRRRIVAASDDARRRIERDLHDGVQQQLVSLGLKLGAMRADPPTEDVLSEQLADVSEDLRLVLDALGEIARGIHPAILAHGGLAAALKALARRSAVPVELHAQIQHPLLEEVEVAAYYVAAEALTNTAKHARAAAVEMDVTTDDGTLTLMVRDDGVGGADAGGGSGLVGLRDRVEALAGTIEIDSPPGSGTRVVVRLPIVTEPNPIF